MCDDVGQHRWCEWGDQAEAPQWGLMEEFFRAIREGNEGEVIRLLDADPALLENREDDDGDRPLTSAALYGQLGVTRLLIERGANINATGYDGNTALHYAAEEGYEEVATLLFHKGAHTNTGNDYGATPLMRACANGRLGLVKMLLQHMGGQGLDERNPLSGWTQLHYAANGGREQAVRFLLLAGADPTITNNEGRTPRAIAEEYHYIERIREGRARCVAVFQVSPLTC
jgi:ankyrin repeat protein